MPQLTASSPSSGHPSNAGADSTRNRHGEQ